jgi:sarcosine/dimethylglycine N-methyltransferase
MSTPTRFTEQDVEDFFDQTTQTYLSFWDSEGVLHTGYFAGDDDDDYQAAAVRTSELLATEAGIDSSARVLDAGCGCGNFLFQLAATTGATGTGLDLSAERIKFAQQRVTGQSRISFQHGSVTSMPFEAASFSHVVSQDALFLVPDKPRSHAEIFRVLQPGGLFAFSDFLQPTTEIGDRARQHVYDRVRWSEGYSLVGYQVALAEAGFEILLARSLRGHISQTYRVLGAMARARAQTTADTAARDWMLAFAESCGEIQAAISRGEFGWGIFVARKPDVHGA